jgi:hypothetical protein
MVAAGDEAGPVVEGLAVGAGEVGAAFFHFDQDERLPDVVGEGGAAAVFFGFANAEFGGAADFEEAFLAEGLEEAVEEDLRLALFVAGDVGGGPIDEFLEPSFSIIGHAKSLLKLTEKESIMGRTGNEPQETAGNQEWPNELS